MHGLPQEHLEGYLSGLLLPAEQRALETHLAGCPACREELRALEGSARELQLLRPPVGATPVPGPGFFLRVMQRIEDQKEQPFWTLLLDPLFGRRLVFACLMLLALLGGYLTTASPVEPAHMPEAILAGQPVPGSPLGVTPRLGPNLDRNRGAVLAALVASAD